MKSASLELRLPVPGEILPAGPIEVLGRPKDRAVGEGHDRRTLGTFLVSLFEAAFYLQEILETRLFFCDPGL